MKPLEGKVALVTGGNKGIGRAISLKFAQAGAAIAIAARDRAASEAVAAQIRVEGGMAVVLDLDVSREDAIEAAFAELDRILDGLHILVNNAGIGGSHVPVAQMDAAAWDRVLAVNLRGPMLCARAAFGRIVRSGGGTIVNISSRAGKESWAGLSDYSAAKAGLLMLTQALAAEGEEVGIKASAICPGMVATHMTRDFGVPEAKMLQPEDVAQAALYLVTLGANAKVLELVLDRKGAE